MESKSYSALRIARICSQLFFLGLFFFLLIKTDYTGSDTIEYAVNILFRIDPLLALCTLLAGKVLIALMAPALLILLLSLLFGRGFCGWFCPVGTMLDGAQRLTGRVSKTGRHFFPGLPSSFCSLLLSLLHSIFRLPGILIPFQFLSGLSRKPSIRHLTTWPQRFFLSPMIQPRRQ